MLAGDVRHALRVIRTHKVFSAAVVLIMALATGANTAVFMLVNAVILSPLPFPDPGRLVEITGRRGDAAQEPFSIADFRDLREGTRAFERLAAAFQWSANITGGDAERLQGMRASAALFTALGAPAALGRTLVPDDERHGGRRVVLLTHGLWQRRFGSDPAVVGSTIVLNGDAHLVVGVLPAAYVTPIREAEVIAPFPIDGDPRRDDRDARFLRIVGRLRPDVSVPQATGDLDRIMARLKTAYPTTNANHDGVRVVEWHRALVAKTRPLLLLVQAAVALVLAVACANLANLFLVSTLRRERELAVRSALGASRVRLARGIVFESAFLASLGAGGGIVVAVLARRALEALAPGDLLRIAGGGQVDGRVIAFAAAAAAIATMVFAAIPVGRLATGALGTGLQSGARTSGSAGGRRARRALVGVEVALASALVTMAVVLSQSFARLQAIDPGFRADHLLTVRLSLPKGRYPDRAAVVRFVDVLRPRLLALPDVIDAAAVNVVPLNGYRATADIWPGDRPEPPADKRPEAHYRMAGATYLQTFGVPLVQGRGFDEHDVTSSEPVTLVNRSVARRFWPDRSPIGQYLLLSDDRDRTVRRARIVGVVGDVRHFGLEAEATPDVYVPIAQVPEGTIPWLMNNMYWGVRTTGDPRLVREAVRREIRLVDPDVPASAMRTMEEALELAAAPRRLNLWLVRVFGLAALALASAGIYAVTAFSVSLRTREIGIRAALGARPGDNLGVMLRDAAGPIALGLVAGALVTLAGTPALRSLLFGVDPIAPATLATVSALLMTVGLLAALAAAWRVKRIDPIVALRAE